MYIWRVRDEGVTGRGETVNSEQVSVGRGVPPSRQPERNKNMNDTTKSKTPRAADERFVARGRRAYWENGRPARCMGRIRTVHRTDETSVLPVKAPRASTNWDGRDAKPAT